MTFSQQVEPEIGISYRKLIKELWSKVVSVDHSQDWSPTVQDTLILKKKKKKKCIHVSMMENYEARKLAVQSC